MNDNEPVATLSSYPLASEVARHMAALLVRTDGQHTMERLLAEMALLPAYEVVPQENGMTALARLGGEGTLLLFPNALLIPMMAETILKFMLPKPLHAAVRQDLGEDDIATLLSGGA